MERDTDTRGTETDGPTTPAATGGAARRAGAASPEEGGRACSRLAPGWRFVRHLLEIVVAMMVGMGAFGAVLALLGEPPARR